MRVLLILTVALVSATAQSPTVRLMNTSRPASNEFQIGDRYEVLITGAAQQPVSVRTTRKPGTDWGPVIGWTDSSGRWSAQGQFVKGDFGGGSDIWTVGGRLANPAVHFSLTAPCLKGGQSFAGGSGPNMFVTCETAEGRQTFVTPSDSEPFRTLDGRVVPGRMQSNMTAEQYRAQIIEYLITSHGQDIAVGRLGDEAGDLILKMIGVNALSEDEARNVLSIVRAAFEKLESIPQAARDPSRTLVLLRSLEDAPDLERLRAEIDETIAEIQRH